jgi:acyl dehydratase
LTVVAELDALMALVGSEIGVSQWEVIDQDRIDAFAGATGDHQWIHVDRERAAQGPFGGTIAHGFLTLSLIPALLADQQLPVPTPRMGINYGLDRTRFITPVPVGSRVRARTRLDEVTEVAGGVQLKRTVTVELEGSDKPALVAETLTRLMW